MLVRAERQDVTVNFIEPRDESVRFALERLPGVVAVEPQRTVAARIRSGFRDRYLAITGVPPNPRFKRIVDRDGREIRMPPAGVVLSLTLANVLRVRPGDEVSLEVLEGQRPTRRVQVTGLVDDIMTTLRLYSTGGQTTGRITRATFGANSAQRPHRLGKNSREWENVRYERGPTMASATSETHTRSNASVCMSVSSGGASASLWGSSRRTSSGRPRKRPPSQRPTVRPSRIASITPALLRSRTNK